MCNLFAKKGNVVFFNLLEENFMAKKIIKVRDM